MGLDHLIWLWVLVPHQCRSQVVDTTIQRRRRCFQFEYSYFIIHNVWPFYCTLKVEFDYIFLFNPFNRSLLPQLTRTFFCWVKNQKQKPQSCHSDCSVFGCELKSDFFFSLFDFFQSSSSACMFNVHLSSGQLSENSFWKCVSYTQGARVRQFFFIFNLFFVECFGWWKKHRNRFKILPNIQFFTVSPSRMKKENVLCVNMVPIDSLSILEHLMVFFLFSSSLIVVLSFRSDIQFRFQSQTLQ